MSDRRPLPSRWRFMIARSLAGAFPYRTYYYFGGEGFGGGGTIGRSPPQLHHRTRAAHYECRLPGIRLTWRVAQDLPNAA